MAERKTMYKWYWAWDFDKEERWLNEMAQSGWALVDVGWCRYTFEACVPGEYVVRLEMHPADESYLSFMEETGAVYVGRVMQWIFFRRKAELGSFELFSDIDSKIAHLDRISKLIKALCIMNLGIGVMNSVNPVHVGWINLLMATLLTYGLGRI